ncbi:phytase [Flavicella sp.]|uniref:phytase n=1 Tax=Flavicella sp. TaxID=2957742 RepID=UPI0030161F66
MKQIIVFAFGVLLLNACEQKSKLLVISPDVITEKTLYDTDDPAIWVNPKDPSKSIVFGTDKDTNGAVYAFDLEGKIIESKTIRNIQRPNNVDVEYGLKLNDSTKVDVLVFTERERQVIRVFSIPDMQALDNGGIPVFEDETVLENRLPMGISLYKSPKDGTIYAIVSRKTGPLEDYLYQYELVSDNDIVSGNLVRKFGSFSGKKEIEAIAVDSELGFVYYSDEMHCVRKYYAEPSKGNRELSCFGAEDFLRDIEGIAIAKYSDGEGYIIVSDQQRGQFNLYDRKTNEFIKTVDLSTTATDGCEVVTVNLNEQFSKGLFVAMNDAKDFYFYDLSKFID